MRKFSGLARLRRRRVFRNRFKRRASARLQNAPGFRSSRGRLGLQRRKIACSHDRDQRRLGDSVGGSGRCRLPKVRSLLAHLRRSSHAFSIIPLAPSCKDEGEISGVPSTYAKLRAMTVYLSRLATSEFVPGAHPLESKQLGPDPKVARVRFDAGFEDPAWCPRNHVILVEDGALTIELEGETMTVEAGEILRLAANTRHRASNRGSIPTTLLIISDLIDSADSPHHH